LNLASLWKLPILFICENNLYAMGTALKFTESETNISLKAASYRIDSSQVDGMDIITVAQAAQEAVAKIKNGNGPVFIECLTYRFRAHSMFDAELYRDKTEVAVWKEKDPLVILHQQWPEINIDKYENEIALIIDEAVAFAQNGTLESIDDLEKYVYSSEGVQ
ncbi:MAG: thiamine pyrophosphate-dependent enzyme, partial [Sulfuricurvum sp.]|nr:thiamine pyrophosphate-dependent enzyme [Sulfuricurvum sp.]